MGLSDGATGAWLLVASLALLIGCLVSIVRILSQLLKGRVAEAIKRVINADIPYVPWLTG